jgi:endonuclease-3
MSLVVGTPWRYSTGARPSVAAGGAARQNTGWSASVAVCSVAVRSVAAATRRATIPSAPVAAATVWQRPAARRVRALRARLREMYGVPVMAPHGDPLGELVLTVLSQSTNDRNRDVAFLRLRERFPAWEAVRDAPVEEIEEAIRPGGISKVKSVRIQDILRAIGDPLDLSWKTAACVLLFAYGLRDVPVDTHVGRVATRLALLRPGARSEEQHDALLELTPPGAELEFHVNMLRHGRRTCHAQRPACRVCALRRMCPSRRE